MEVVIGSSTLRDWALEYFRIDGQSPDVKGHALQAGSVKVPIRDGIPRFTPDESYSSGNFEKLREEHATLQLDSVNRTSDRRDTILSRTGWAPEFFRGKTVLECGCGAGPDTEVLLSLGARVIGVDLAGLDVARRNLGDPQQAQFVQADITRLPFRRRSFDIVFCHRVLQHTPEPEDTLDHILGFVKDDGAVFAHSYARTWAQMFRWKYFLRPVTTRLPPELLYRAIEKMAPALWKVSSFLLKSRIGRRINRILVPFCHYGRNPNLSDSSKHFLMEFGIHDTFDALSPRYDSPLAADTMRRLAERHLQLDFEVVEEPMITLLRTRVPTAGAATSA